MLVLRSGSVAFQDKLLSLAVCFQQREGEAAFALKQRTVKWSRDGRLLRTTLQEGRFGTPCLDPDCGFVIYELSLPDPEDKAVALLFDLSLDHNLSGNLDQNGAFESRFHFRGTAFFRAPR